MPSTRNLSVPVLFSAFFLISYYVFSYRIHQDPTTSPLSSMVSHDDSDILSELHVGLRQTSKSPPAITITVTNNSTKPLTILAWDSPLDELALQLGLLVITPEGAPEPLDIPTIKVNRKLPPGEDSLVSLAPGESRENQIVLGELVVPPEKIRGNKTRVELGGKWSRVWLKLRSELTEVEIADLGVGDGTAVSGEVVVDGIDIDAE